MARLERARPPHRLALTSSPGHREKLGVEFDSIPQIPDSQVLIGSMLQIVVVCDGHHENGLLKHVSEKEEVESLRNLGIVLRHRFRLPSVRPPPLPAGWADPWANEPPDTLRLR